MYLCNINDAAVLCICDMLDIISDGIVFIICPFAFQIFVKLSCVNSKSDIFRNAIGCLRILLLECIGKFKLADSSDGSRQKHNQSDYGIKYRTYQRFLKILFLFHMLPPYSAMWSKIFLPATYLAHSPIKSRDRYAALSRRSWRVSSPG